MRAHPFERSPETPLAAIVLASMLLLSGGCSTVPLEAGDVIPYRVREPVSALTPAPLAPLEVTLTPEATTVEDSFILDLYDWLKGDQYRAYRVDHPGADGKPARAHLLIPPGAGPHPAVVVFPIRGGSHVVSEALAKALVNRGYVVLRLERRRVFRDDDRPGDFTTPAGRLRDSLLDARRLIGWLETHPEVDRERLATAGVSLGGILAATLMGVDERIQAGLFIMAGGGLPELLHDSGDGRLRRFRERALERAQDRSREAFVAALEPHTRLVDPLSYANRIDPRRALLVSGRFDRVVPPQSTETLWEAMGRPTWLRFPTGHYQFVPFFWWAVERGSQFFGRVFSDLPGPQQAAEAMELVPAAGP